MGKDALRILKIIYLKSDCFKDQNETITSLCLLKFSLLVLFLSGVMCWLVSGSKGEFRGIQFLFQWFVNFDIATKLLSWPVHRGKLEATRLKKKPNRKKFRNFYSYPMWPSWQRRLPKSSF